MLAIYSPVLLGHALGIIQLRVLYITRLAPPLVFFLVLRALLTQNVWECYSADVPTLAVRNLHYCVRGKLRSVHSLW